MRSVLVTGADSGFGLATTLRLAGHGWDVTGLVRDDCDAVSLREAARCAGVEVGVVVADLTDPAARAAAVSGLDCWALVNNAGVMDAGAVLDVPLEDARRQLELMVVAPVDLARRLVPAMRERGTGRVVNITSAGVHVDTPLTGWYTACKAALRQLNDAMRQDLRGTGVAVVDVEPGGAATGIWGRAARELRRHRPAAGGRAGPAADRRSYDAVIAALGPARRLMPGPELVARAVEAVLDAEHPPAHRRVGPDAAAMRLVSDLVPERLWDAVMARVLAFGRRSRR